MRPRSYLPAIFRAAIVAALAACVAASAVAPTSATPPSISIDLMPRMFAPGVVTSEYSDVRLTLSPDGQTALWFSRDRPGGPGGYDIWISRRTNGEWSAPRPAPFDSPSRDFDPAFSADGRYVYFASDRAGGAGGDDVYRVPVTASGFGAVESLGDEVNTARNEWAPMLAPDGRTLLFSSDGHGGAGRMDLFTARRHRGRFAQVSPLPGAINTPADEFDATFLADSVTVVFSRSQNLASDPVALYVAERIDAAYLPGKRLPGDINTPGSNTYAPMLDWSAPDRVTFTTRRPADSPTQADLYTVSIQVR
jgi:TolB protein